MTPIRMVSHDAQEEDRRPVLVCANRVEHLGRIDRFGAHGRPDHRSATRDRRDEGDFVTGTQGLIGKGVDAVHRNRRLGRERVEGRTTAPERLNQIRYRSAIRDLDLE
jgi:hypothetical protein